MTSCFFFPMTKKNITFSSQLCQQFMKRMTKHVKMSNWIERKQHRKNVRNNFIKISLFPPPSSRQIIPHTFLYLILLFVRRQRRLQNFDSQTLNIILMPSCHMQFTHAFTPYTLSYSIFLYKTTKKIIINWSNRSHFRYRVRYQMQYT